MFFLFFPNIGSIVSLVALSKLWIIFKLIVGGAVAYWLLLLNNFIQQSLKSGSAQVQILLAVC